MVSETESVGGVMAEETGLVDEGSFQYSIFLWLEFSMIKYFNKATQALKMGYVELASA